MEGKTNFEHYSPTSLRCILINGNCHICRMPAFFKPQCQMRKSVKKIIKNIGAPKMSKVQEQLPTLSRCEQEILDLLAGGKDKIELVSILNKAESTINNQIHSIACKYKAIISYTPDRSKISQVVEFVKTLNIKENIETFSDLPDKPEKPVITVELEEEKSEKQEKGKAQQSADLQYQEKSITGFTERELECLTLLCQGLTYSEIAKKLIITETTVKTHTNNIFQKLHVNDRINAVLKALQTGLVNIELPGLKITEAAERKIITETETKKIPLQLKKLRKKYMHQYNDLALQLGMDVLSAENTAQKNAYIKEAKVKAQRLQDKIEGLFEIEQDTKRLA